MTDFQKILEEKKRKIIERGKNKKESQTTIRSLTLDEKAKQIYIEMIRQANIPGRYREKNFVNYEINRDNKKSYNKVLEYLKKYHDGSWLFMYGNYGTGKTHLAIAGMKKVCYEIAKKTAKEYKEFPLSIIRGKTIMNPVYFVKTPELLEEIKSAYEYDDVLENDVIGKYKHKQFLVVDDLGSEKPSDWQQEKIYSILDYRYSKLLPTIITTNCSMNELIERIGQRVVDRIQEAAKGYRTSWRGESYRTKEENNS